MEELVQFFYLKDDVVILKEKFSILPEAIALKKAFKNKEHLGKTYEYIHFVYSKKSAYFYVEINDRKKIVCADRFNDPDKYEKIEKMPEVKAFVDKYNQMQFTENEMFLKGVRDKISEYLRYWQNTPINKSNSAELHEQLKASKDLLRIKKELMEEVYEEMKGQRIAKESGTTMFEEPD